MSRTFQSATIAEFQDIVASFPWSRRVTEVHLHATGRPRHADYEGVETILGLWRDHTSGMGWGDIAQHVTVAPDGAVWLGRNFNWAPASAPGFNGNAQAGPFMVELVGDFDRGRDEMTADQRRAALSVIKVVQERFQLPPEALRLHHEMSDGRCPGDGLDKARLVAEIGGLRLPAAGGRGGRGPFEARAGRVWQLIQAMRPGADQPDDPSRAEHPTGPEAARAPGGGARGGGGGAEALPPSALAELADHVVNLERGAFSQGGRFDTDAGDVDRIFEEVLPAEIAARKSRGQTAHLLIYAHGGLVSESGALAHAHRQIPTWRANGIYPLFFVWESGFGETIRQMVQDAASRPGGGRAARAFFTDGLIEEVVRALKVGRLWDAMKLSAALASAEGGGAAYVAAKAAALVDRHGDDLAIHAAGHSAGAIFHSHFVPRLVEEGGRVATLHLLAPAVRNDLFHRNLAPLLGEGVGSITLFTMRKALERVDTVSPAYRKSLLYLVHAALEAERQAPILGLEASLRADPAARAVFGLDGTRPSRGRVVWSVTDDGDRGASSASTTHGGFDDDAPTLGSIVRRILGRTGGEPIAAFPPGARGPSDDPFSGQVDWPEHLEDLMLGSVPLPGDGGAASPQPAAPAMPAPARPMPWAPSGRLRALCIGIDGYPGQPLQGCVADAELWGRTLSGLGYEVATMRNGEATGDAIRARVAEVVAATRPGDSSVIQFAGHGTGFADHDGDEAEWAEDQCLCAVDCDSTEGGLVIDDELRAILAGLADGAALTCFFDCCHSGTATRAALRASRALRTRPGARGTESRARFYRPTPFMEASYQRRLPALKAAGTRAAAVQREVLFSACTAQELAYESAGQGDFTLRATQVLAASPTGLTNRDFLERVLVAFGDPRRQNPQLDCDLARRSAGLLAP